MWKNLLIFPVSFNWLNELVEANYYFSKGLPKNQIHFIFQNTTESTGISSLIVRSILLRKLKRMIFFYVLSILSVKLLPVNILSLLQFPEVYREFKVSLDFSYREREVMRCCYKERRTMWCWNSFARSF